MPRDIITVLYKEKTDGSVEIKKVVKGNAHAFLCRRAYLDPAPFKMYVNLNDSLTKDDCALKISLEFTAAISSEQELMRVAAERLLGLTRSQICELVRDIATAETRLIISDFTVEEIDLNRDVFFAVVNSNVDAQLKALGLSLVNVKITDLYDEVYFKAKLNAAAAEAIKNAANAESQNKKH